MKNPIVHVGAFALAALVLPLAMMLAAGFAAAIAGREVAPLAMLAIGVSGPTLVALFAAARSPELRWFAPLARLASGLPPFWVLAFPLVFAGAAWAGAVLSGGEFLLSDPGSLLGAFAVQLLVVALLEEIGWRGYLTPALMRRISPLAASLIVGSVWFFWHAPKFGIGPLFVAMLLVACLANSVVMTKLVTLRGGLVACVMFHGSFNLTQAIFVLEETSIEAQYAAFGSAAVISSVAALALIRLRPDWWRAGPGGSASQDQA